MVLISNLLRGFKKIFSSEKRNVRYLKWKYPGIRIGKNCTLTNPNFGSEPFLISIGDNVRVSKGVVFTNHDGGMWVLRNNGMAPNGDRFGPISIGNNVHIGMNSMIMPGVTIGDNVIVGAGSIVTKSIPSNSVAAGVPAKIIETVAEYYEKHVNDIVFTKNMKPSQRKKQLIKKYYGQ
jgi:acetyltransferase-like isoleucine patch superfamily enzyme